MTAQLRYAIYPSFTNDTQNLWHAEKENEININIGKNEYQNIQISLFSEKQIKNIKVSANVKQSQNNITFEFRKLAKFQQWNDALIPFNSLRIEPEQNCTIWMTIKTDIKTPAKKHIGQIKIQCKHDTIIIPITINVINFTIPIVPSIPVTFGIIEDKLEKFYKLKKTSPDREKIFADWFNFLCRYRISPYFCRWLKNSMAHEVKPLPVPLTDKKAKKYLCNPVITRYAIPFYSVTQKELKNIINLLKSLNILNKSFFYIWDEPDNIETYHKIYHHIDTIRKIAPEAKILTTFYCGPNKSDIFNIIDKMRTYTNIFCISSWAFHADEDIPIRFKKLLNDNEELWTYVCCGPSNPQPNLHLGMKAIQNRAILWRIWKEQIDGFLYWAVNSFDIKNNRQIDLRKDLPPGDGLLIYPGEIFKTKHPIASIRLEQIRAGLQDYEYLKSAEKTIGRSKTLKILNSVYKSPIEFTDNPTDIQNFINRLKQAVTKNKNIKS